MSSTSQPWYPHKGVSYGSLFFYIRGVTHNVNPFDKKSIKEARSIVLKEARKASPSYKMFIEAATKATGLGETTIKKLIYNKEIK